MSQFVAELVEKGTGKEEMEALAEHFEIMAFEIRVLLSAYSVPEIDAPPPQLLSAMN